MRSEEARSGLLFVLGEAEEAPVDIPAPDRPELAGEEGQEGGPGERAPNDAAGEGDGSQGLGKGEHGVVVPDPDARYKAWVLILCGEGPRAGPWQPHSPCCEVAELVEGVAFRAFGIGRNRAEAVRIARARVNRAAVYWATNQ